MPETTEQVTVTLSLRMAKLARALLRANYREQGKHHNPEDAKDCRICQDESVAIHALGDAIEAGERGEPHAH